MSSTLVPKLNALGYSWTKDQLYWLAAIPGLSGGLMRIVWMVVPPILGTRKMVTLTTLLLVFPVLGWGVRVQSPTAPYWELLTLAFLAGIGGGAFSGFMPSTSYFFPRKLQGTALGLQAGIGNFGVSLVQQEPQLAPALTVGENIMMGRLNNRRGFVAWRDVHREAERVLDILKVDIPSRAVVSSLSAGRRQLIEVAKGLVDSPRILLLDEATSSLDDTEAGALFDVLRRLCAQGVAIAFVSQELPTSGPANVYYWYYGTLAMRFAGGEPWQRWNEALQQELLGSQRSDGSWDPDRVWGGYGGKVYQTALSALCLEAYYRYDVASHDADAAAIKR